MINRNAERGVILISSYLVLAVMGVLSLALFTRNFAVLHAIERNQGRVTAFNQGEAGLDRAFQGLRASNAYAGTAYTALGRGGYDIAVTQATDSNNNIIPNIYKIVVNGYTPNNDSSASGYERRQIESYVNVVPQSPFLNAAFARANAVSPDPSINIKNSKFTTDSYDSQEGSYASQVPAGSDHAGNNGDIGTNSADSKSIKITGTLSDVNVYGDAVVGNKTDPVSVVNEPSVIKGSIRAETAPRDFPAVTDDTMPASCATAVELVVDSVEQVMAGGTYCYTRIVVRNGGTLRYTGPAKVYIKGTADGKGFKIKGASQILAQDNLPQNLSIFVKGSKRVTFGGGTLYGTVYAPESNVKFKNVDDDADDPDGPGASSLNEVFGGVIGNKVVSKDTLDKTNKIHYDEALRKNGPMEFSNSNAVSMKAWQEIGVTYEEGEG